MFSDILFHDFSDFVLKIDGVWHKDSHYRSQLIGGVHKLMILITEALEDLLQNCIGFFLFFLVF